MNRFLEDRDVDPKKDTEEQYKQDLAAAREMARKAIELKSDLLLKQDWFKSAFPGFAMRSYAQTIKELALFVNEIEQLHPMKKKDQQR